MGTPKSIHIGTPSMFTWMEGLPSAYTWGYLGSQQHMMQMLCWAPDIDIYKYLCLSTLYCIDQTFDIVTYDYQCFFRNPQKNIEK